MTPKPNDPEKNELRAIFVDSGHRALNALLLVTGGTAIAFLSFLGGTFSDLSLVSRIGPAAAQGFVLALQAFVSSVALCILAYASTYVGHAFFFMQRDKGGDRAMRTAFIFGLFGIFAFSFGSYSAIRSLKLALDVMLASPLKS